jgi:hypothetical protein
MAVPKVSITKKDLARGIDTFSAKGSMPDGCAEDLQNVDTNANGKLSTRHGYEGYYGWLPLRVTRLDHSGTAIRFQLDQANTLDLTNATRGPLIAYGRIAESQAGDFDVADSAHYYSSFSVSSRDTLSPPSGTLTKSGASHGIDTSALWVGLAESTAQFEQSNIALLPDDVQIDTSTLDVTIDYTVSTAAEAFVYFRDMTAEAGRVYTAAVTQTSDTFTVDATTNIFTSAAHGLEDGDAVETTTDDTLPGGLALLTNYYVRDATTNTYKLAATEGGAALDITDVGVGTHTWHRRSTQITASTHGLDNFNIILKAFDSVLSAGKLVEVIPQTVSIDSAGVVRAEFGADFTGNLVLEAAPIDQASSQAAVVVGGGPTTNTFVIDNPGSPFLFFSVYRFNAANSRNESVLVHDWSYDETTDQLTIEYVLSGTAGEPVDLFWVQGSIVSNIIEVTDTGSVSTTYTEDAPQITLWGIDHTNIYRDATAPGGHVTHIDAYRRVAEERVIAGLGGNIYRSLANEEGADQYLMGDRLVNLRKRVDGDTLLAPLFYTTDPGSVRTRGVIYDTTVANNRAQCTAATYVSAGIVDYTLAFTSKSGVLALNTQVSDGDYLTVTDLAHTAHTGTWRITAVTDAGTTVTIRCENANITNATFDETGMLGRAGVFTDTFALEAAANFTAGDRVLTGIPAGLTCTIVGIDGVDIYVDGVTTSFQLPDGAMMFGERTSTLVPLRNHSLAADVSNIVRGDMLRVSDLDRRTRVMYVNVNDDLAATLVGDGTTITATTGSDHLLSVGQHFLLGAGSVSTIDGEYTVTAVPTSTTFEFAGSTVSGTATVLGLMIEIDEALTFRDGNDVTTFVVDGRWVPVEAPTTAFDLPKDTYIKHFDRNEYDEQPTLRSTTVADSMFFTNQDDEVLKFDGDNLYRAGFPRWQLGLFVQNDTSASAKLSVGQDIPWVAASAAGKYYQVESALGVQPGDRIYNATLGKIATIVDIDEVDFDNAGVVTTRFNLVVRAEDDLTGVAATGTLKKVQRYKYFARMAAVDPNNNIIVGTEVNSEDLAIDYTTAGQLKLRLVGMPAFDIFDYDRLSVELFRTRAGGSQFYLVARQFIDFDNYNGYIDISDATEDSFLLELDDVAINTIGATSQASAAEVGTAWDQPPRAKHITSASTRLLLANVRGYPELDLVIRAAFGAAVLTAANLAEKILLFRRDGTDTGTTTNMVDRARYQFYTSGAVTIDPATDIVTTSTQFTVSEFAHGLSVGDWIYMFHSAAGVNKLLSYAGWWQVAEVPDPDTFVVYANDLPASAAADVNRYVAATAQEDIPVWLGTDGNYGQVDAAAAPSSGDITRLATLRLANAINASMRMTARSIAGQEAFVGWMTAAAGNDYGIGQIKITHPNAAALIPEVVMPSSVGSAQFFVNDIRRAENEVIGFVTRLFPSRLLRSYKNFPELFDAPLASSADFSDSVIDINPADGQEITAMIPFFGESSTGENVRLNQEVVVFKTDSIYLVNVETRAVQRIDSRGLGCTAPRSVASSKNGIMFANASGLYMLTRSMEVVHAGINLTGLWRRTLNRDQLVEATGHHYGVGRRYKLSVPTGDALWPTQVFVYDYDREAATQQFGAWSRYTNHLTTGWCNLGGDAFWGSQDGDVFLVRNRNEASDFRDEAAAVAEQVIILRAEDFDLPGIRKVVAHITTLVELDLTDLTDLAISVAQDLSTDYQSAGSVSAERSSYRHVTFAASPPSRRGSYVQVRYTHETIDEELILTGVAYEVGQLSGGLVKEVADLG